MLTVSHPTGNTFVRALLESLESRALLHEFCTTLAVQPNDWPVRGLPTRFRRQALRRGYSLPQGKVVRHPLRELARHAASALGLLALTAHESGWASVDAVYTDLDRYVARRLRARGQGKDLLGVYCYEDCAFWTFPAAKEQGLTRFYDLPIAYWETSRRLLEEEAARWPEWEPTLGGTRNSAAKQERKTQELRLADVVLTPSRFVLDSLPAETRASKACYVAEFGSPVLPSGFQNTESEGSRVGNPNWPLRVLFAGSLTQRKGLADLFTAMKLLKRTDVDLVVLGTPVVPLDFYRRQYAGFHYEAPRPHSEVLALMRTCDILALPSLVEGRALVQQEALACGLPLLVTSNAGGEDLIDEGETGYLVPIRSPEAIAEKIAWFADHRDALPHMAQRAQAKATEYTWGRYGQTVTDIVSRHAGK